MAQNDELRLVCLDRVYGNIQPYELFALVTIVKSINASQIFEIGTFDGRTTRNLAANIGRGGEVHTLDLVNSDEGPVVTAYKLDQQEISLVLGSQVGRRYKETPEEAKIIQLFGDSARFEFDPYFGKIDLVFVDGSHALNYVRSDTSNAFKMAKKNSGVVVWHDYGREFPDVRECLTQIASDRSDWKFFHLNSTLMVVAVPCDWAIAT